jgi:hypothetical protein
MDIPYTEKINWVNLCRTLAILINCLLFLSCDAQIEKCIERFNQKELFVKFEKVDREKEVYQPLFDNDSLGSTWSILMLESIEKSLTHHSSLGLKKSTNEYSITKIDLEDLNYILRSIEGDGLFPKLIVIAVLFKNENESLIDLFYFKRKKFCKHLDKVKFLIDKKTFLPDKKINIKGFNKKKSFKKNILLIIRNGLVEKIEL